MSHFTWIPPLAGALSGYGFGWLLLGRLLPSLAARNRGVLAKAARERASDLSSWALSLPLARIVPPEGTPGAISFELMISGIAQKLLASRETIYAVRDAVSRIVADLSAQRVCDVAERTGLAAALADRVLPALFQESRRRAVAEGTGKLAAEQAEILLGNDVLGELTEVLGSYLPEAADTLLSWMQSPETRAVLSERGRELLPRILEKLSEMQKFFISAGQFDRRLAEKMPEIIDETIRAVEKLLRDPLQQKRIAGAFFDSARDWRDALRVPPAPPGYPGKTAREKLADSVSRVLHKVMGRFGDPAVRHAAADFAFRPVREDRRTMGAFFRDTFGVNDTDIVDAVSSRVLERLTRPETAQRVSRQVCSAVFAFAAAHGGESLGAAFGIDPEKKRQLDSSLRSGIPRVVEDLLPVLSRAMRGGLRPALISGVSGAILGLLVGFVVAILHALGYQ